MHKLLIVSAKETETYEKTVQIELIRNTIILKLKRIPSKGT